MKTKYIAKAPCYHGDMFPPFYRIVFCQSRPLYRPRVPMFGSYDTLCKVYTSGGFEKVVFKSVKWILRGNHLKRLRGNK